MDNEIHRAQATIYLIEPLKKWLSAHGRSAFVGGNSPIYYDPALKKRPIGPDFYVVNGGQECGQGKWVMWEEQNLPPTLVVEMLSPTTEANDRNGKFVLYRDRFRCPDYFLLKSEDGTLEGFHLVGRAYVVVTPDSDGRLPCSSLPLKLGIHNGWLRFFELDGTLVPTDAELVARERVRAEQADERAEAAEEELRRAELELKQQAERAERAELEVKWQAQRAEQAEGKADQAIWETARKMLERGFPPAMVQELLGLSAAELSDLQSP